MIKVRACPINPAGNSSFYYNHKLDNASIKGKYYNSRAPPTTVGLEGSGVVVKGGPGFLTKFYLG